MFSSGTDTHKGIFRFREFRTNAAVHTTHNVLFMYDRANQAVHAYGQTTAVHDRTILVQVSIIHIAISVQNFPFTMATISYNNNTNI